MYNILKNKRWWRDVDTSTIMYKLQLALKQEGVIVTINTNQFYSNEQDRFIKMYTIKKNKKNLITTASQIQAIQVLNQLWQEVKNEKGN